MKKRFLLTTLIFTSIIGTCFGATFATTLFKNVRASINKNYVYTLNGKTILDGQPALMYRGTVYAPIADLATALGYNASIQEDSASLTTPKPTPPPKPNNVTINRAVIDAIDFASNRITVHPINNPNEQIDLLIKPDTKITYASTGSTAKITDLNTSILVKVVHSPQMTKSIPPQTTAISISILNGTPIQPR